MNTSAEFVESDEIANLLEQIGVVYVQSYVLDGQVSKIDE